MTNLNNIISEESFLDNTIAMMSAQFDMDMTLEEIDMIELDSTQESLIDDFNNMSNDFEMMAGYSITDARVASQDVLEYNYNLG